MQDYKELMRSREFHFLVGSERSRLTIHANLVQNLSRFLHNLMNNGQTKESISGEATFEEVEEETFIAFCEFCYRGSYSTPTLEDDQGQTNEEVDSNQSEELELISETDDNSKPLPHARGSLRGQNISTSVESSDQRKRRLFKELKFDGNLAISSPKPDLLAHAKIYLLADKYFVDSLKDQSLKSLHRDLCNFDINHQTAGEILDLINYCYNNNTGDSVMSGGNALRSLVIEYTSCEIRTLTTCPNDRFRGLLKEFPDIGADLIPKLVE